jgi:hypothetical protein
LVGDFWHAPTWQGLLILAVVVLFTLGAAVGVALSWLF